MHLATGLPVLVMLVGLDWRRSWCRELAANMKNPKDKLANELMADAWEKIAN
jgi:hypothetical protein